MVLCVRGTNLWAVCVCFLSKRRTFSNKFLKVGPGLSVTGYQLSIFAHKRAPLIPRETDGTLNCSEYLLCM